VKRKKERRKKKQTEEKVGTENKAWMVAPRQESSLARARAGAEAARQSRTGCLVVSNLA